MRTNRVPAARPDLLSRSMDAHALAEDQRSDAERVVAGLRHRAARARAAAGERRRMAGDALRRGEEVWGLSLLDAARHAEDQAAVAAARLRDAELRAGGLASVERARREELFRALGGFLVEIGEIP